MINNFEECLECKINYVMILGNKDKCIVSENDYNNCYGVNLEKCFVCNDNYYNINGKCLKSEVYEY